MRSARYACLSPAVGDGTSSSPSAASLLIVGLDNTIVNVALPSIRREFNASVSGLQWTVAAYTLVLASLLMLSGSTADRIGRRRVFQAGLATFTGGSLLCSLAPSLGWLIAFRMVQAVGGSIDHHPRRAHVRHHRGPRIRLDVTEDHLPLRPLGRRARAVAVLRAAP